MTANTEGVGTPTPSERESARRYLQGELDKVTASAYTGKVKVKFLGEGESHHLNITAAQYEAIKKIIVPEKVTYDPCIQGTIDTGGRKSEFFIPFDRGDVGFSQWGADNEVLWERVSLLDALSGTVKEWWLDNRPREEDDDECECSESYRHRGEHTPGCPADDGERGQLDA